VLRLRAVSSVIAGLSMTVAGGVVALAAPSAQAAPSVEGAASAGRCAPMPPIRTGKYRVQKAAGGVVTRSWTSGDRQVAVTTFDLKKVHLKAVPSRRFGEREDVLSLASRSGAIAIVNADYYRFAADGAFSAGVQVAGGKVRNAPWGRTRFVGVGTDNRIHADESTPQGSVKFGTGSKRFSIGIGAVNPTSARLSSKVAVYTRIWTRKRPTTRQEVLIRNGRVARVGRSLAMTRTGDVVVSASGASTRTIGRVRVGMPASVSRGMSHKGTTLRYALGSGARILRAGENRATCTARREVPRARTAIAWNPKGSRAAFVTITAPSGAFEAGLTHHQAGEVMKLLGFKEAVMFDGGTSTTLITRSAGGRLASFHQRKPVRNLPNAWAIVR
jgi:exopolysaccharide biosynthesis protein